MCSFFYFACLRRTCNTNQPIKTPKSIRTVNAISAGRPNNFIKPSDILALKAQPNYKGSVPYKSSPYPEPITGSGGGDVQSRSSSADDHHGAYRPLSAASSSLATTAVATSYHSASNALSAAAAAASLDVLTRGVPNSTSTNTSSSSANNAHIPLKSTRSDIQSSSTRKQNRRIGRQESRYTSGKFLNTIFYFFFTVLFVFISKRFKFFILFLQIVANFVFFCILKS